MKNKIFYSALQTLAEAERLGIIRLIAEDSSFDGKHITLGGKRTVNFGSCSYMGLEFHERLKEGAIDAILRYGIQFSSSRSYVSCPLYKELEALLSQVFQCDLVLAPTITLGHQAAIPVLIREGDAIIMDQYAHASLQHITSKMQLENIPLVHIRHNSIDELETKVKELQKGYKKIWFVGDSVYSMHGDVAPLEEIVRLLNKYTQFHAYIDDAHGMSWTGKNGRGYVLNKIGLHEKLVVAMSFAKAFGSGGGAILLPNKRWAKEISLIGGPLIFSGPNQIPTLGASIASAKIHLTDEIYTLQSALSKRILLCNRLLEKYQLPIVSDPETPIFFLALGNKETGYRFVKRMIDCGFYLNLAIFPAVPPNATGARFTITTYHSVKDITDLVECLSFNFNKVLEDTGFTFEDVQKGFKKIKKFVVPDFAKDSVLKELKFEEYHSINDLDYGLWKNLFKGYGSLDNCFVNFHENNFKDDLKKENAWSLLYFVVKDLHGKVILATVFTKTFIKDDIIESREISVKLEEKRRNNPYFLCSDSLLMGFPGFKGNYLYLDKENENWKIALGLLLERLLEIYSEEDLGAIIFRDLSENDLELKKFMFGMGFQKIPILLNNELDELAKVSPKKYLDELKKELVLTKKNEINGDEKVFSVVSNKKRTSANDIDGLYKLYRKANKDQLTHNSFDWPSDIFQKLLENKAFNLMELYIESSEKGIGRSLVGFVVNYVTQDNFYYVHSIGLDTNYSKISSEELYLELMIRNTALAIDKGVTGIIVGKYFDYTKEEEVRGEMTGDPMVAYVCYKEGINKEIIEAMNEGIKELK